MELHIIHTGFFKLDGGAMFGVVPKRMWQRLNPPDDNNMCTWAMRCLLLRQEGRNILIDTGIGDKQGEKFRSHFEPHGEEDLMDSLSKIGLAAEDITDVLLTHLHFDHVGGAVKKGDGGEPVPAFPNATYWSNAPHYDWAMNPNPKEAASFLKENFVPLREAGKLRFIDFGDKDETTWQGIRLRLLYGHTHAMMMPIIPLADRTVVYCADLIPSVGHLGLPYIMSYDIRPLLSMKEKERLLDEALRNDWHLVFEHDPSHWGCSLTKDKRGRIVAGELF